MCYTALTKDVFTSTLDRRIPWRRKRKNMIILAWEMLSKTCAKLSKYIEKIICETDFIDRHRNSPKFFIRDRILSFQILILFLINFVKGSYQDELDNFFKHIKGYKVARRIVTKSALSKARKKIKYQAFIEMNKQQIEFFNTEFQPRTWHGYHLMAFDGSTVRLPHAKEIINHFGAWPVRNGKDCPLARLSQMYDTLNKISIDAIISPKAIGERELAAKHCQHLQTDHLVLLDRGYPAFWLFKLIIMSGAQFCARIPNTSWLVVRKFYLSGANEKIVTIPPTHDSSAQCKKLGIDVKPLRCRLIRIELDSGEVEILITSLRDDNSHPHEMFKDLYHLRWPIEEDYKVMKVWLILENFTGKSVESIYQDFHAKIFSKNFTSILAFPTQKVIDQVYVKRKHPYQINFAQALSKTKHVLVLILQRSHRQTTRIIKQLHEIFVQTVEMVRPNRHYARLQKATVRKYFQNYKPLS